MDGNTPSSVDALEAAFAAQRSAFSFDTVPTIVERKALLARIIEVVRRSQDEIIDAIHRDFGGRSAHETLSAEIALTVGAAEHAFKNLSKWARPKRIFNPPTGVPGRAYVRREAKGVVGIVSPWNYPFQLAMVPAISALAGGNRVLIKPSEYTPQTGALLQDICAQIAPPDVLAVVTGGPDVGAAFSALAFDHLFFTGSTRVGRLVAQAAAANLTPVTLELGGKSPSVMMPDASPEEHGRLVTFGKWYNAGQTCVAPDYLLVPKGKAEAYGRALLSYLEDFYGDVAESEDYTAMIAPSFGSRMETLAAEAEAGGARLLRAGDPARYAARGRIAPTVVLNPPLDGPLMTEEIFGPLMPIIEYDNVDEAVQFITDRDHPLALYVFGKDVKAAERILERTTSGGAVINAAILHFAVERLPFGGVGKSGYGACHGRAGFDTFTHGRSVLVFPQWKLVQKLATPPYNDLFRKQMAWRIGKPKP